MRNELASGSAETSVGKFPFKLEYLLLLFAFLNKGVFQGWVRDSGNIKVFPLEDHLLVQDCKGYCGHIGI